MLFLTPGVMLPRWTSSPTPQPVQPRRRFQREFFVCVVFHHHRFDTFCGWYVQTVLGKSMNGLYMKFYKMTFGKWDCHDVIRRRKTRFWFVCFLESLLTKWLRASSDWSWLLRFNAIMVLLHCGLLFHSNYGPFLCVYTSFVEDLFNRKDAS